MKLSVQEAAFDVGAELNSFQAAQDSAGAIVSFSGIVRDNGGTLLAMEMEHYPAMTERAITAIMEEAKARFNLDDVLVIHRYGRLLPQDQIMMVATAARHRVAAFEAAEFLMDYLKSRAPFWKKEITAAGEDWVKARGVDHEALKRWGCDGG